MVNLIYNLPTFTAQVVLIHASLKVNVCCKDREHLRQQREGVNILMLAWGRRIISTHLIHLIQLIRSITGLLKLDELIINIHYSPKVLKFILRNDPLC